VIFRKKFLPEYQKEQQVSDAEVKVAGEEAAVEEVAKK